MSSIKPEILLIASQMPQQELGLIAQLLQSHGYRQQPASERSKKSPSIVFETSDKANSVRMMFYQEIGALRLELFGEISKKIGVALGQYMDVLNPDRLNELFDQSQSDMERRIYAILLVLAYPDGVSAMDAMRDKYFVRGSEATREGLVQGLAFLETPDVGIPLEEIEKTCKGENIAVLARRAIDGLGERGLIRESVASFRQKVEAIIDENPKSALEQIEKYVADGPAPEIRALHAKALRMCGRMDEAGALLAQISISEPDAVDAFCERALIREAGGHAMQAMSDVQAALACDPNHAAAAEIFMRLKLVLENSASSAEDRYAQFSRALEANPDDVNMLCQRAECLLEMRRAEEAVGDLTHAQQVAPNDQRLPYLLCEANLKIRRLGAALDQASKAQKIHVPTQETMAWLLKPRVFIAMDLPEKALGAIHEIPADIRENDAVVFCEAVVDELLGRADEAKSCYERSAGCGSALFDALDLSIYRDLPLLRRYAGIEQLVIRERPKTPLDLEPSDPFFKRCDACGALTMKRRTYCRECSNGSFFE